MGTIFEKMMNNIMNESSGSEMLADCMTFDVNLTKKVPLRYRIIALGFVKKYDLEELNEKLKAEGCAQLYSRNFWEASLIFAFLNHMSYKEWMKLQADCAQIRDSSENQGTYFNKSSVTLSDLEEYIRDNSDDSTHGFETRKVTSYMEAQILKVEGNTDKFKDFMKVNLNSFSEVREKTRYYFCKYLDYYLKRKIDTYFSTKDSNFGLEQALSELLVFKGVTKLRKGKMSPGEEREFLYHASISSGEIFDAFNYFYYEYVSLDWLEVLLEYYGDIGSLPTEQKHKLASSLRRYDDTLSKLADDDQVIQKEMEKLGQREEELDEAYSLEGGSRGYQRNRSGENTVRKFIKGSLDIDRTTLICFLLFFSSDGEMPQEQVITEKRLNDILLECGFSKMRSEDNFDYFVIQYLKVDDPVDYLMEQVTDYALQEKDFFLYNMFKKSRNNTEDLKKIMGI